MNKAQKIVVAFFVISLMIIAALFVVHKMKANPGIEFPKENVLYYSELCPHCKNVEKFMEENNVASRIEIAKKEALVNLTNKAEMKSIIEKCRIDLSKAGFPLLYTGAEDNSSCLMGDADIISFFKSELNISG